MGESPVIVAPPLGWGGALSEVHPVGEPSIYKWPKKTDYKWRKYKMIALCTVGGKTKVSHWGAAGKGVACWGPMWATSKILRLFDNLQKPLVKRRFGAEASKWPGRKQARGRRRCAMETAGGPSKALGKQRFPTRARRGPCANQASTASQGNTSDLVLLVLPRIVLFMLYVCT